MEKIIDGSCIYIIIEYLDESARFIIGLTHISKRIRTALLRHAKRCLQIYYRRCMRSIIPPNIYKYVEKYGGLLTGSTTLQIFENVRVCSDIDLIFPNNDSCVAFINACVSCDDGKFQKKYICDANQPIHDVAIESEMTSATETETKVDTNYIRCGYVNSIYWESLQHNSNKTKIDVLNNSISGIDEFDISICSNTISCSGHSHWGDLPSIMSYQFKYRAEFKQYVAQIMKRTPVDYRQLNSTRMRTIKYIKRGYDLNDDMFKYVPMDSRRQWFESLYLPTP